ncbi:MAG TPA: response regulator, partial [Pseudoxanthomonas sp.]|nr:response regulator [Pseudoxanthomonas sp.]
MSATDSTSRAQDEPPRNRVRAETPPPHYWRRWTNDMCAPEEFLSAAASVPSGAFAVSAVAASGSGAKKSGDPQDGEEPPFRVLIVEDDRGQALFAKSVLHGAGMTAEVEMAPQAVLPTIERFKPDLVLMDLHMPDRDGMTLTVQIRQRTQFLHLPIVFLTGDADPERQFEVLESGADDFLNKPIRPRHLIAAVSNRIKRARQRAPAPVASTATVNHGVNPETGLPTRAYLMQQLTAVLERQETGGLLFIEISGTRGLRERYGYASFEQLMTQAGRQLAQHAAPHALA